MWRIIFAATCILLPKYWPISQTSCTFLKLSLFFVWNILVFVVYIPDCFLKCPFLFFIFWPCSFAVFSISSWHFSATFLVTFLESFFKNFLVTFLTSFLRNGEYFFDFFPRRVLWNVSLMYFLVWKAEHYCSSSFKW